MRRCPRPSPIVWAAGKTKVLIIGGGSSHDFGRFFGGTDSATLAAAGFSVNYTEDRDQAAAEIGKADVAVISVNRQFFDTPAYRKALFDFAAAGKGLVMLHPGTWYGFAQWPELNAAIVGGGARGHDRIAEVLGQCREAGPSGHEGRAGVVRGRGRALLHERGSGQDSGRHGVNRGAGGDLAERAVHSSRTPLSGSPATPPRASSGSRSATMSGP